MGVRYKLFSRIFLSFISCWVMMTFNRMERTKLEVFSHILNIVLLLLLFAVLRHLTVQCMTRSTQFTACTFIQANNI